MSVSTSGIGGAGSFDPSKFASNLVKKLDTNEDGSLDKTEFVNGLTSAGVSAEDAAKKFDSIDTKKAGKITQADIEADIKSDNGGAPPAAKPQVAASAGSSTDYDKKDANKDGTVSGMEELIYDLSHQSLSTSVKTNTVASQDIGQHVDVSA